jgi:hypothetical protein
MWDLRLSVPSLGNLWNSYLNKFEISDSFEGRVKKCDLLYPQAVDSIRSPYIYAVTNVIRVFDEQKYAGSKEFLCCDRECKR